MANGYSTKSVQYAKSAGRSGPKTPDGVASASSMSKGTGTKANAKRIVTSPGKSLSGMAVGTGKSGGYKTY